MSASWYLLRTKLNKERLVFQQLQAKGIDVLCPTVQVTPATPALRDIRACFRGYLFVHLDPEQRRLSRVNWLAGAQGLIEQDGEPVVVPAHLIRAVLARLAQDGDGVHRSEAEEPNDLLALLATLP